MNEMEVNAFIQSQQRESTALELAKLIADDEKKTDRLKERFEDPRTYWQMLYSECLSAVSAE